MYHFIFTMIKSFLDLHQNMFFNCRRHGLYLLFFIQCIWKRNISHASNKIRKLQFWPLMIRNLKTNFLIFVSSLYFWSMSLREWRETFQLRLLFVFYRCRWTCSFKFYHRFLKVIRQSVLVLGCSHIILIWSFDSLIIFKLYGKMIE